jgi:adenosine kinase
MKILLSGSFSTDQIMNFDGLFENLIQPDKLHVLSISTLVESLKKTRGGIAANIAYSLALLKEKPLLYVSAGTDATEYVEALSAMGIDTSYVHFSQLPTATFSVLTDKNDCQVGGFYPGAMADAKSLSIQPFADQDVFVVISAHDPKQMIVQARECMKLKKRLFFDVGQQIIILSKEDLLTGLEAAELIILNDYEMGVLEKTTGLSQKEIVNMVDVTIITLGEKGSVIYAREHEYQPIQIDSVKVDKVVDPTGAGDAFRAGFLYGYVSKGYDLKKSAQIGSVTAAYAVEHKGTQEHHFSLADIQKRYTKKYKETL